MARPKKESHLELLPGLESVMAAPNSPVKKQLSCSPSLSFLTSTPGTGGAKVRLMRLEERGKWRTHWSGIHLCLYQGISVPSLWMEGIHDLYTRSVFEERTWLCLPPAGNLPSFLWVHLVLTLPIISRPPSDLRHH